MTKDPAAPQDSPARPGALQQGPGRHDAGRHDAARLDAVGMVRTARERVVARVGEAEVVAAALSAGRNVVLEGPPGTGKTTLLRALADGTGVPLVLVEGNAELTPTRLVGHHDASRVLTEDYRPENFVPGPLTRAMTEGALLYVEEFNRVPEETMNVLLGVLSEREMHVPRFGRVPARPTFRLVAAMNPFDAVGTARITPALYDRSCRVAMGYQDEDAERAVVAAATGGPQPLVDRAVRAVRITRDHAELRIGASVRGAIDTVLIATELAVVRGHDEVDERTGADAALAALTGKVTVADGLTRPVEAVVTDIWRRAGEELGKP